MECRFETNLKTIWSIKKRPKDQREKKAWFEKSEKSSNTVKEVRGISLRSYE
jgi:hypothetical protein